jgi:biotin carboxyl carrier protein
VIFDADVAGRAARVEVKGGAGRYTVQLDGRSLEVLASGVGTGAMSLIVGSESHELGVEREGQGYRVAGRSGSVLVTLAPAGRGAAAVAPRASGPARLVAPMPGRILRLLAAAGADVAAGQGLLVIEAMKMENELRAPRDGKLRELLVREGEAVEAGALLAVVG